MQLTKYTHSCVRLDDGDRSLVIDPGVFSEVDAALDGVDAVLITHEHPDHIDTAKVTAALRGNPRLRLFAPAGVATALGEFGEQVVAIAPGDAFEAAGFPVRTFGGQHAVIHPSIPVIANNGYFIADSWSKASEVIDFAIAVRAPRVHQVHDSLVTDVYAGLVEGHLDRIAGPFGVSFTHLKPAATVSV